MNVLVVVEDFAPGVQHRSGVAKRFTHETHRPAQLLKVSPSHHRHLQLHPSAGNTRHQLQVASGYLIELHVVGLLDNMLT
jgi:hypothetical protein